MSMNINSVVASGLSKVSSADASHALAYLANANETLKYAGHYMIEVLDGVHAGSTHIQRSGSVKIGNSRESDMVLFGAQIAPNHLELILRSGLLTKFQLRPIDAPVTLEDGSIVEIGQVAEISADEVIRFGDTEITVSRIADPKTFIKPGIRILAFICVLAMIPLVYGLAAGFVGTVAEAGSRVASSVQNGIERTSSQLIGTVANATSASHDEAFAWTVRVKLEDLSINHKLRVATTADGSIRVSGNISDKELPRWTSFLQWYDTTTNFPPLIRDVSRTDVDQNLPKIKSVWLDDNPSVFFNNGVIGNIGSEIQNGWKIIEITDASVMIERDGTVISLTF